MKNINMVIRPYDAATDLKILSNIWFEASMQAHPFIGETRQLSSLSAIPFSSHPQG